MRLELVLDDRAIQQAAVQAVKDYILNDQMVRNLVRQAMYKKIADTVSTVLSENNEGLNALVAKEVKEVLQNRSEW